MSRTNNRGSKELAIHPAETTRTTTALLQGLHDEGNGEAWGEFDARYRPIIIGFARRLGLNDADAADVAQNTLLKFVSEYRQGGYDRSRGRLRSWLIGLAKFRVAAVFRDRDRRGAVAGDTQVHALPDDAMLTQAWEEEHRAHVLRIAMQKLRDSSKTSDQSLEVFDLLVVRGIPVAEVAERLRVTAHDVYQAKSRVAARLRVILDEIESAYGEPE